MQSLQTTSGSQVTCKWLPSLALGNDFREMNVGELPEVTATAGGCGDCWKLRRLLEAAEGSRQGLWYEGKCSCYFNCYFFRKLQQTETSGRKLSIYQSGFRRTSKSINLKTIVNFEKCLETITYTHISRISNSVTHLQTGLETYPYLKDY